MVESRARAIERESPSIAGIDVDRSRGAPTHATNVSTMGPLDARPRDLARGAAGFGLSVTPAARRTRWLLLGYVSSDARACVYICVLYSSMRTTTSSSSSRKGIVGASPYVCQCFGVCDRATDRGVCFIDVAQYHQYQVVGRHVPTESNPEPEVFRMKLWALDDVKARSKFWYVSWLRDATRWAR